MILTKLLPPILFHLTLTYSLALPDPITDPQIETANTILSTRAVPGYNAVYREGDPGNGIGGYDLHGATDRAFAFDYDHSGKKDHLVLYRPGSGAIFIIKKASHGDFQPVYKQGAPGSGIGGYDLRSTSDRLFAFDYTGSGKLDHIVAYRAGHGTIFILQNKNGVFSPVFSSFNGIGGYDLKSPIDAALAFDYEHTGKLDHLVFYRPGSGTLFIIKHEPGTPHFYSVFTTGSGIGGYDLKDRNDLVFALDYTNSGKRDHLVLYRPGRGAIAIVQHTASGPYFYAVFFSGSGIGGFDLKSPWDRLFALDDGNGKLSSIAAYRAGSGVFMILGRNGAGFAGRHAEQPGAGIGGYDFKSVGDIAFSFDYASKGNLDYVVAMRPGKGAIFILEKKRV